jgi:hypothetical protein
MKTAAFLAVCVSTASAFAPSQSACRSNVAVSATAELEGLIGTDIESGKKIVSLTLPSMFLAYRRCDEGVKLFKQVLAR